MIMINTDSTDMSYVKLKIAPFNMPSFHIEPPSPFYNYCSPLHINLIDDRTHESLLAESLDLYNDIWTTLAQV